ncbi:PIR Superfamily Protein [Plasmodium ovale curtisi]|uniref:PIR Superfamily Protein n=1 Tax=Plasmodium ovale curtisi TaxID=864141 RepID=A0A1A8WRX7_PLAOA|nr:PIR Superfamily Protein [Plasmodium ovale curtisi]SBT01139.1 PIR Superfamily Protein [Plasmodium ovale curtisi]
MSLKANSTEFFKLFRKSSKDLFSDQFYEALNSDSPDLSKYDNQCNDLHVYKPKDEMIKICKKYLRYLEYCKLLHDDNSLYKVSLLFNYWLYGMLTHIYGANSTDKIRAGFGALQYKWTYFDYYRKNEPHYLKCKPNFEIVNHNDWDKRKKLYDYYVDYDILFGLAKSIDDKCETYYKKIEEKKSLYEHFDKQCLLDKDNCPNFYDKCKPYEPDSVLSQLPCHEQIAREQNDAEAAERSAAVEHTSGSEQDTVVGSHGPGIPGFASGSEIEVTSETSQIGTKLGQSVLGITPVLLTASALYRYTPIGSWIRNLGKNSTNSISDMDGEMEGFLGYTQESGDILLDGTSDYISYQPM